MKWVVYTVPCAGLVILVVYLVGIDLNKEITRVDNVENINEENPLDITFSRRFLQEKIDEAKSGQINHQFVQLLVSKAENAESNHWWESALDKYKTVLNIYQAGDAHKVLIAASMLKVGAVQMRLMNLNDAEGNLSRGLELLEAEVDISGSDERIQTAYVIGMGYLGRTYRLQKRGKLADKTIRDALSKTAQFFGEDSETMDAMKNGLPPEYR